MDDFRLVASWVAEAMGGTLTGDGAREFSGVSIDTRTLEAGELFIAIRGERFDGAAFVDAAMAAGAAGVVVPRGTRVTQGREAGRASLSGERLTVIEVDDTTIALQALARAIRRESGTKVVAITGSAGKTTTKEVASTFLSAWYRVIRNQGNLNNHIGLPLSLIALRRRPEIAVVELGMNHVGEVSTLVGVAEPDVRVWTNVGEAHVGFFASVDAIADAKAEIFERATRATLLIANADDARIVARLPRFAGRVVTFGIDRDADVRATDVVDRGVDGMQARITTPEGRADMTTPLLGRANLANILAATTENPAALNSVFNIALGETTSLNQLFGMVQAALRKSDPSIPEQTPIYDDFRPGDVRHSQASIQKAQDLLGYEPTHRIHEGLTLAMDWYRQKLQPAQEQVDPMPSMAAA